MYIRRVRVCSWCSEGVYLVQRESGEGLEAAQCCDADRHGSSRLCQLQQPGEEGGDVGRDNERGLPHQAGQRLQSGHPHSCGCHAPFLLLLALGARERL